MKPLAIGRDTEGTGKAIWAIIAHFSHAHSSLLRTVLALQPPVEQAVYSPSPVIPQCGWCTGSVVTLLPLNREWKVRGIETGTRKEVRLVNKPQTASLLARFMNGYVVTA